MVQGKIKVYIDGVEALVNRALVPKDEEKRDIEYLLSTITDDLYDIDTKRQEDAKEKESQTAFRQERDSLLIEADHIINTLSDKDEDTSQWKDYRIALRDSTKTWVLPNKPQ